MNALYVVSFILGLAAANCEKRFASETIQFGILGGNGKAYRVVLSAEETDRYVVRTERENDSIECVQEGDIVRWWYRPHLVYHSEELGQLAVVPYYVGGGTGYGVTHFKVLACPDGAAEVLYDGQFAEHCVSPGMKDYVIQSSIKPTPDGFIQSVRVEELKDGEARRVAFAPVHFRFHVARVDGHLTIRREVDRESALLLAHVFALGPPGTDRWAARELSQQWPALQEVVKDTADGDREHRIKELLKRLSDLVPEVPLESEKQNCLTP